MYLKMPYLSWNCIWLAGTVIFGCFGFEYRVAVPDVICSNSSSSGDNSKSDETKIRITEPLHLQITYINGSLIMEQRILGFKDPNVKYDWDISFVTNGKKHSNQQRYNLLVWRCVRELETMLKQNSDTIAREGLVSINNTNLMPGVKYIFNMTTVNILNNTRGESKQFVIDYVDTASSNQASLNKEPPAVSLIILGPDLIYADLPFLMQAEVSVCAVEVEYQLEWSIKYIDGGESKELPGAANIQLEVPANTFRIGVVYKITCSVIEIVNKTQLSQAETFLNIYERPTEIAVIQKLIVSKNEPFVVIGDVWADTDLKSLEVEWKCDHENRGCPNFNADSNVLLNLTKGFPETGVYLLMFAIQSNSVSQMVEINIIDEPMPVINILSSTGWKHVNPSKKFTARAIIKNIYPGCYLQWSIVNETDCSYLDLQTVPGGAGTYRSINSLEGNFLDELADFSNETSDLRFDLNIPGPKEGNWAGLEGDTCYKIRLIISCSDEPDPPVTVQQPSDPQYSEAPNDLEFSDSGNKEQPQRTTRDVDTKQSRKNIFTTSNYQTSLMVTTSDSDSKLSFNSPITDRSPTLGNMNELENGTHKTSTSSLGSDLLSTTESSMVSQVSTDRFDYDTSTLLIATFDAFTELSTDSETEFSEPTNKEQPQLTTIDVYTKESPENIFSTSDYQTSLMVTTSYSDSKLSFNSPITKLSPTLGNMNELENSAHKTFTSSLGSDLLSTTESSMVSQVSTDRFDYDTSTLLMATFDTFTELSTDNETEFSESTNKEQPQLTKTDVYTKESRENIFSTSDYQTRLMVTTSDSDSKLSFNSPITDPSPTLGNMNDMENDTHKTSTSSLGSDLLSTTEPAMISQVSIERFDYDTSTFLMSTFDTFTELSIDSETEIFFTETTTQDSLNILSQNLTFSPISTDSTEITSWNANAHLSDASNFNLISTKATTQSFISLNSEPETNSFDNKDINIFTEITIENLNSTFESREDHPESNEFGENITTLNINENDMADPRALSEETTAYFQETGENNIDSDDFSEYLTFPTPLPVYDDNSIYEAMIPRRKREDTSTQIVYADFIIYTNSPPKVNELKVTPAKGIALNTIFKFSSEPAKDDDKDYPLLYTFGFFTNDNPEKILLSSNYDLSYIETVLPFQDSGLTSFLEVCDNWNSCRTVTFGDISIELPFNIEEDITKLFKKIETFLNRRDYLSAFRLVELSIISYQTKKEWLQKINTSFQEQIANKLQKFQSSVNDTSSQDDLNSFLYQITKVVSHLDLPENILKILVGLQNRVVDTNTRKRRQTEMKHSDTTITPFVLFNFIQLSTALIQTASNPQEEKAIFLSKLQKYVSGFCNVNEIRNKEIEFETAIIALGIQKTNLYQHFDDIFDIPFGKSMTAKVKFGKEFRSIVKDEELYLSKVMFEHDYLVNTGLPSILTKIFSLELYSSDGSVILTESQKYLAIHFKIMAKDLDPLAMCAVRLGNNWNTLDCRNIELTKYYIHCECSRLGYFTVLRNSEDPDSSPGVFHPTDIKSIDSFQKDLGRNLVIQPTTQKSSDQTALWINQTNQNILTSTDKNVGLNPPINKINENVNDGLANDVSKPVVSGLVVNKTSNKTTQRNKIHIKKVENPKKTYENEVTVPAPTSLNLSHPGQSGVERITNGHFVASTTPNSSLNNNKINDNVNDEINTNGGLDINNTPNSSLKDFTPLLTTDKSEIKHHLSQSGNKSGDEKNTSEIGLKTIGEEQNQDVFTSMQAKTSTGEYSNSFNNTVLVTNYDKESIGSNNSSKQLNQSNVFSRTLEQNKSNHTKSEATLQDNSDLNSNKKELNSSKKFLSNNISLEDIALSNINSPQIEKVRLNISMVNISDNFLNNNSNTPIIKLPDNASSVLDVYSGVDDTNNKAARYISAEFGAGYTEDTVIGILLCGIIGLSMVTLIIWKRIQRATNPWNEFNVLGSDQQNNLEMGASKLEIKYGHFYAENRLNIPQETSREST